MTYWSPPPPLDISPALRRSRKPRVSHHAWRGVATVGLFAAAAVLAFVCLVGL